MHAKRQLENIDRTDGRLQRTFSKYSLKYMTITLTISLANTIYYQDIELARETAPPVKRYFSTYPVKDEQKTRPVVIQ